LAGHRPFDKKFYFSPKSLFYLNHNVAIFAQVLNFAYCRLWYFFKVIALGTGRFITFRTIPIIQFITFDCQVAMAAAYPTFGFGQQDKVFVSTRVHFHSADTETHN